jgi:hypothetical protein
MSPERGSTPRQADRLTLTLKCKVGQAGSATRTFAQGGGKWIWKIIFTIKIIKMVIYDRNML